MSATTNWPGASGADDVIVDQLEIEIDEMSIQLLSKAPLATDLRLITVAMKISHDLERVSDEATTIARRSVELEPGTAAQALRGHSPHGRDGAGKC